ncbi:YnbE family lipoprotein [Asticcacaulis sp. EMRT-3]|uniref:YnbE family lipoprotein n=1 Tax=Asticcacaulis sp. EMRT-3 TaxID=3040349 RepID=UPI0024AECCE9|nr:YnbE family lipoprotein [Asticcacaulis sp. EMRT-3]MDI7776224.1 YnbE family lipoprotein [Asticcacaulis sp. EMRT-3]
MKTLIALATAALCASALAACTPSVNVNVNLAPIYAKLDVNVKVQLDQDVKALVQQNPDLF